MVNLNIFLKQSFGNIKINLVKIKEFKNFAIKKTKLKYTKHNYKLPALLISSSFWLSAFNIMFEGKFRYSSVAKIILSLPTIK